MIWYIVILTLCLIYYMINKKYDYFKKKKVPHLKPTFLLGNYGAHLRLKKSMSEVIEDICKQFPDEQFIGAYLGTEPVLIPIDPEIIKLIVTKDFYYFNGRELTAFNHLEPVSLNLFATSGDSWKVLRQNMSPLFSTVKMKNMFHLIQKCSYTFETALDKEISMSQEIDVKFLTSSFTIECIASCGFGVDANTMTDDPKTNHFRKLTAVTSEIPSYFFYKRMIRSIWPTLFYNLKFKLLTTEIIPFHNLITAVIKGRNETFSGRNDFIDLILSWKLNNQIVGDKLSPIKTNEKVTLTADDELLVAQCFVFFNAGFETSSSTISNTLFELAKNPEVQDKVLQEVDDYMTRHENKLQFDCMFEMPYLEACVDETLRLHPVLGEIFREQADDYTFPNGVRTEKGMRIHLPIRYLHYNPKYFPNPEEFRPERFLGEEKKKIVPYTYMPFGEGPRLCIGMRFAKMQMIAGFITILKKYRVELAEGMPSKIQLKADAFVSQPVQRIMLKFIERDGWEDRVFVK